jgi:hypothetical protein
MLPNTARWQALLLIPILAAYGAALGLTWGFSYQSFDPQKDEVHFWETTEGYFVAPFPPSAETLRSYPELITPLSYIIWGQLERATGQGLLAGRILNLALSLAIMGLLIRPRDPTQLTGFLAGLGMIFFPYFLSLGVHLYTDMIGVFFTVFALHCHLRGRLVTAALLFVLAISTRQYLVQVPAALVAWEGLRMLRGERRWKQTAAPLAACASLLGWIVFWGGFAPEPGMEVWIPRYPSPMLEPTQFILKYGSRFLIGIGIYFVVPEALLFRDLPPRSLLRSRLLWTSAIALGVLFALDPPLLTDQHPGGVFGRAARLLLPGTAGEPARIALFYGLALATCLRFLRRMDLSFWLVLMAFVMAMKSQLPWEKYYLPTLLALWYLRSRGTGGGSIGGRVE